MLSWEMSPLFSRLESLVLQEFSQLFGLGNRAGGVMLSGGSLANLQALAVARNLKFNALKTGIVGQFPRPVLFASEVAHTSIQKSAMLLGLGTDAVIPIKTNHRSQISIRDLENAIETAQHQDQIPFCMIATIGTTTTGNIDPVLEMSQIARKHGIWFHVDAAYGGALVLSEQYRPRLAGIEYADSITFNPQKWMYVARTCVMLLFREVDTWVDAFRIPAPYMRDSDGEINLGEISVQGTRHAEILKLWLSLQHLGKRGYAQLIEESYCLTSYFVQKIRQRPFLEMASEPETNIICFRGVPDWIAQSEWDNWNQNLHAHLLEKEQIFLSLPFYRGSRWLRSILLNPYTDKRVIDRVFDAIDAYADPR